MTDPTLFDAIRERIPAGGYWIDVHALIDAAEAAYGELNATALRLRDVVGTVWGERDRWDADPAAFIQWTREELICEWERDMKAEARVAELEARLNGSA